MRQEALLAVVIILLLAWGLGGRAQAQVQTGGQRIERPQETGPLSLSATGKVGWIVKYGLGDPRGLTDKGYANQLLLEQALSVDAEGGVRVEWPLSGVLSISAHLDNQKAENLQLLAIKYRGKDLEGEFGDFTVAGNTGFTGYDKKLKGLKVDWTPQGDLAIQGVLARVEGIPREQVFHGNTSPGEITYSLHQVGQRWLEQPYLKNIRGLEYYEIAGFVPGFTKLKLNFDVKEGLRDLLGGYGLGYLFPTIREEVNKEIDQARYLVVNKGEKQFLILRREALELLRDAIKGYIDGYNEANNLTGDERKEYPLNEGSDYERGFLEGLVKDYVAFNLDGTKLKLDGFKREKFYYLGHAGIDPDSVKTEVKLGEGEFTPLTDPGLVGYDYYLFPDEGIIELDFPAKFFAGLEENRVRVSFNYAISGGMYILGLSIVKGSEKVYLNGKLLQRDQDYTIDYETGALLLFRQLTPTDELRIDYEIFRGGLGGATEYKRNLGGVLISYRPADFLTLSLDLLQAADSPVGGERSGLKSMPNDHIVGGLSTKLDWGGFQAGLELGYNYNRFPFDDNQRKNRLNRINAIRAISYQGREYILFGTQDGLVVFDGERWREIGPAEGLAGHSVRDIASSGDVLVFATNSGISLLKLEGEAPFAILPNWRRFYKQDGLPSQDIYAALIQGGTLYLGTAEGLARVPLEGIEQKENWEVYRQGAYAGMVSDRITSIAGDGRLIYLGTDEGLMIFDPQAESFSTPPELRGARINGLFAQGGEVLVATGLGIRAFERGRGSGWLSISGARAVAAQGEKVWFSTAEGLYRLGESQPLVRAPVTALGVAGSGLWVGTEAHEGAGAIGRAPLLTIWQIGADEKVHDYPQQVTRIDGRDLYRFDDIPAAKHTDLGPALILSLSQDLGKLKLKGSLKDISPKFTALGSEDRQDLQGWSLEGDYEITPKAQLGLKHEASLVGAELARIEPLARKSYSEKDSLDLKWDFGPQLELGYSLKRINNRGNGGFDEARHDLKGALSGSLFAGRLGLSLSYELLSLVNLRWKGRSSQDHRLAGEVDLRLLPGLEIQWHYTRPVKVTRFGDRVRSWGSEGLDLAIKWSQAFPGGSVNAAYNREGRSRIPQEEGGSEADQDGQVELQLESLKIGELTLYPQGTLSFQRKGEAGRGQLSFSGAGGLRSEFHDFKAQANYKLSSTVDEWSRRREFLNNLSLHLDYGGWGNLKPSLNLQGTTRLLSHPSYGKKTLENWAASASLGWKAFGLSNNTSLSQTRVKNDRERTTSYSLRNVANFAFPLLPKLSSSLEAVGGYAIGERKGKPLNNLKGGLTLKGSYPLGGSWGASGLVGYVLNIDNLDPAGSYQSLYFSAQVATTF